MGRTTAMGSMTGRVCLVTGGNRGIGKATAMELARRGATVTLTSRDRVRGERAAAGIRERTGNPAVRAVEVDFSSPDSIRLMAGRIRAAFDRLHVLLLNHALVSPELRRTPDGVEMTFAVNHLGVFAATLRLLDLLERSAPARIVVVSSDAHSRGRLDLDDLGAERGYHPRRAYQASKLANLLFTYELARRIAGSGVTANCLHPGIIRTRLFDTVVSTWFSPVPALVRAFRFVFAGPARGARTSVYLASSPEVEGVSGKYFRRFRPARSSARSRDPEMARRLWEVSRALTGLDRDLPG